MNTTGHVTIDLNDFEIVGDPGSTTGIGIFAAIGSSVHIYNGAIKDFPQGGLVTAAAVRAQIENIIADNNNGDGIYAGNYSIITACTASNNNGNGIRAGVSAVITNSTT
ncbi:MAG: right-handed parallel beta-helix repeat-containing protein, partial [Planctomycetota bacterium]